MEQLDKNKQRKPRKTQREMMMAHMPQIRLPPEEEIEDTLTEIRFVGVIFEENEYEKGESRLNGLLKRGYTVIRDFQTNSGIVITLGKFEKKNSQKPNLGGGLSE